MFDHLGFAVLDLARSTSFYQASLAPLSISVVLEVTADQTGAHGHVGFGVDGKPGFWIGGGDRPATAVHIAFTAPTRAHVEAFYAAALRAGGIDNGAPGLRPHDHPNDDAAFVLDPDGNNIEAVCHAPV